MERKGLAAPLVFETTFPVHSRQFMGRTEGTSCPTSAQSSRSVCLGGAPTTLVVQAKASGLCS